MALEKLTINGWQRWAILALLVFAAGGLSSFFESRIEHLAATTLTVLGRILLRVLPFFVLFLGYKLRLVQSNQKISAFRWSLFFGLIVASIMFFGIPETELHAPSTAPQSLANVLSALVLSGHGWLFPGVLLGIFALLIIYRVKHRG